MPIALIFDASDAPPAEEHTTDCAPALLATEDLAECMRSRHYKGLYEQWQAVKTDFVVSYSQQSADLQDQKRVRVEIAAAGEDPKKAKEAQLAVIAARIRSLNERLDGVVKEQTQLHDQLTEWTKCILLRAS